MHRSALLVLMLLCALTGANAQIDPHAAILERAGWDAIVAGRARVAADAFREAIAADPKNARLYLGAATAAFLERRDADAKDALDHALAIDPRLPRARALLGQVLHRIGDVAGAIRIYGALIADTPDDKEAAATLARWQRELDLSDRMQQTVGAHFTVSFEGPAESSLADSALASLERAYWRIGGVLGSYPAEPVRVVLYTSEQFRDITRSPAWAAGAYDGTIRVPMRGAINNSAELDRVLAHEFVHALVRSLASHGVPTWLDEGLATALEADDLAWAERGVQRADRMPSLAQLQNGFGRLSSAQAGLAYATSALAVRRLIEEAGGVAVANLLRDLGDGAAFDASFLHRMQRSFAEFEASPAH
jgi:hypothetical protein